MLLSSACASRAGSVGAVSPGEGNASISGCSGRVNGGTRREEGNSSHLSAGVGSASASESRRACGAGIPYSASNPPHQLTRTSDGSGRQEDSFCAGSECNSGEMISGGDQCSGKHGLVNVGNSDDVSGDLSSISSDHRASGVEPVDDLTQSFSGGASSGQTLWVGGALLVSQRFDEGFNYFVHMVW